MIGFAAIAVFCYGVYVQVRKYRRGRRRWLSMAACLTRFGTMVGIGAQSPHRRAA